MIPRADSDHPIDKIRFGLMVAIGGEDATETLEEIEKQASGKLGMFDEAYIIVAGKLMYTVRCIQRSHIYFTFLLFYFSCLQ